MVAERGAHPQLGCHYEGISPAIGANCQLHSDASARGGCGHRYALVGGTQREYPAFNMISYKPLRRSLAAQCNAQPERCASAGFHNNSQMVAAYRAADFCLQVRPSCIMCLVCRTLHRATLTGVCWLRGAAERRHRHTQRNLRRDYCGLYSRRVPDRRPAGAPSPSPHLSLRCVRV
jgi:hypothetical protein